MTEKRYHDQLAILQEKAPNHPFMPALLRGYKSANVTYLQLAFEQLEVQKPRAVWAETAEFAEVDLHLSADNEVLRDLDEQRRALYRDLFETRKRFFDYPFTDAYNGSRADVSRDVQLIQKRIGLLKQNIRNYTETGQLDTTAPMDDPSVSAVFVVPTDAYERMKKLNSLRAALSRTERELRELVGREGLQADEKKIKTRENARTILRGNLQKLEAAIAADQLKEE
jgi:hypothetical protein